MHAAIQVTVFGFCLAISRWYWPHHKDVWSLADAIASIVLYPTLVILAVTASLSLNSSVESRFSHVSEMSHTFMVLLPTRCVLHIPVTFMQRSSLRDKVLISFHHGLCILALGYACLSCRVHYYATFGSWCEVTNIFLNNVWLFKEVTIGGKTLREHVPNTVYIINGFLLWLSYLLTRLVLFPYWLYQWYRDVSRFPALSLERMTRLEHYIYPVTIVILLILSIFWFMPITKGFLKATKGTPSKVEKGERLKTS